MFMPLLTFKSYLCDTKRRKLPKIKNYRVFFANVAKRKKDPL